MCVDVDETLISSVSAMPIREEEGEEGEVEEDDDIFLSRALLVETRGDLDEVEEEGEGGQGDDGGGDGGVEVVVVDCSIFVDFRRPNPSTKFDRKD